MEYNMIVPGIKMAGSVIKKIAMANSIVDISKEAKRTMGMSINEPYIEESDGDLFAQMTIDFEIVVEQDEEQKFKMNLSIEGAFVSDEGASKEEFKKLVAVNGAAALIGIARGKVEAITANTFNAGKVVMPFVNVIDYYKSTTK